MTETKKTETFVLKAPSGKPVHVFQREDRARAWLNDRPNHSLKLVRQTIIEEELDHAEN